MKKKILISCSLFFLFFGVKIYRVFSAINLEIYENYNSAILDKINTFRENPLKYAEVLGISVDKLKEVWGESGLDYLKSGFFQVSLNNTLVLTARKHLQDVMESKSISHLYLNGYTAERMSIEYGYNALLVSESIVGVGFENYISPEKALEIMLNSLIRDALLKESKEGAPMVFAIYQDLGMAFGGTTIEIEGKKYNIYILCLEYGLPRNTPYDVLVGKVFLTSSSHSENLLASGLRDVTLRIYNEDFQQVCKKITFTDGTFFVKNPPRDQYVYIKLNVPYGSKNPLWGKFIKNDLKRFDLPYPKKWITNNEPY